MAGVRPASFDSSTAMVEATARALRGEDFGLLGRGRAPALRLALRAANLLPYRARAMFYELGSGREGQAPATVATADGEDLARSVVAPYEARGPRRYRAALIGSATGAAVHLCAALGAPLLAQTVLMPLARRADPDHPAADVDACRAVAERLLARNPDLVLHQMADPNNDRLTLGRFAYFRLKRTSLGESWRRFLTAHLEPGATVIVCDCRYRWPQRRVGERHWFQVGGAGALAPGEYRHGSQRVAAMLEAVGAPVRRWATAPDPATTPEMEDAPEAEWGFEPPLADDVEALARRQGWRVVRLGFDHPDDLSPLVADLYRAWYHRRGIDPRLLFVESFVLLDPVPVLRAGAVPFWVAFNGEDAFDALGGYLDTADPYEEIALSLVSNGVPAAGLVPLERWRAVLDRAQRSGRFAGVDAARVPADLGVFARFADPLRRAPVHPLPDALGVDDLLACAARSPTPYRVDVEG